MAKVCYKQNILWLQNIIVSLKGEPMKTLESTDIYYNSDIYDFINYSNYIYSLKCFSLNIALPLRVRARLMTQMLGDEYNKFNLLPILREGI